MRKCNICRSRNGACVQCQTPGCDEVFHVGCALKEAVGSRPLLRREKGKECTVFCAVHAKVTV